MGFGGQTKLDSDLSSALDQMRALEQMMEPLQSAAFLSEMLTDFHTPLL